MPERISTLFDRPGALGQAVLPEELRILYGGDLRFPDPGHGRPYVIGNFAATLDGVVSFNLAGKSGGGTISGFDEFDRFHRWPRSRSKIRVRDDAPRQAKQRAKSQANGGYDVYRAFHFFRPERKP